MESLLTLALDKPDLLGMESLLTLALDKPDLLGMESLLTLALDKHRVAKRVELFEVTISLQKTQNSQKIYIHQLHWNHGSHYPVFIF